MSATVIPIKATKAFYLTNKDNPSEEDRYNAKKYLRLAIKDNPYIKIPEAELSKLYFEEQNKDSSLYYGKIIEGIKKPNPFCIMQPHLHLLEIQPQ